MVAKFVCRLVLARMVSAAVCLCAVAAARVAAAMCLCHLHHLKVVWAQAALCRCVRALLVVDPAVLRACLAVHRLVALAAL